jgi:sirohydrochlorin ferrochelatase
LSDTSKRLQSKLEGTGAQVLLSCLEFIQPHPDQAVQLLADQGLDQVVIMPFLLGHGKHATEELEEVLQDLQGSFAGIDLKLTDGLGSDPRLADLILERVRDLDGISSVAPSQGQTVGVLVVKAGTRTQYDDCLWLRDLGNMVEAQLGPGYAVEVAQSHYGDPTMPDAIDQLVEVRNVSSIICVPYLFFPGMILQRNVLGGIREGQAKYPSVPMEVSPPLGVDDRVVAVAADRIRQVWEGVASA